MKATYKSVYVSNEGWPKIVLQTDAGAFGINIDKPAAVSILIAAKSLPKRIKDLKRLHTHDLIIELARREGLTIEKVVIDRALNTKDLKIYGISTGPVIYSATLYGKDREGRGFEPLTIRPSDGIALAIRTSAAIEVADDIVSTITFYKPDEIPFRKLELSEITEL